MKELIKELNVSIDEKYLITLKTLGAIKPFSTLRNSDREMETLVELYKIYNKHQNFHLKLLYKFPSLLLLKPQEVGLDLLLKQEVFYPKYIPPLAFIVCPVIV